MMRFSTEQAMPFITAAWVFGLSLLSAVVTYVNRICEGEVMLHPWLSFLRDFLYCQMAGLMTYILASAAGFDGLISAAMVSAGSHMGARLFIELEALIIRTIQLYSKTNGNPE
ncbi:MAG: phage holin family protein [Methylococcales bacterium]|jgi:LydA holin phage, holin superfamily III